MKPRHLSQSVDEFAPGDKPAPGRDGCHRHVHTGIYPL